MSAKKSPQILHSPDAEKAVLSCLVLAPVEVFQLCAQANMDGSWFYIPAHRTLWEVLTDLIITGKPADFITIAQRLRDTGKLDSVGGAPAVNELFIYLPTAANARDYIGILRDHKTRRGVMAAAENILRRCVDGPADAGELAVEASAVIAEIVASARVPSKRPPLIEFRTPSQLKAFVPPAGSVLVGDCHIVRGVVFVIGGAPGVGKSRAGVALAEAGATGFEWFGLTVHRKFKTMIIQNENGEHRLKNEFSELNTEQLDPWVRVCVPPPFGLTFDREDFRALLSKEIADFGPDVILLDPWNAVARDDKAADYLETFDVVRSVIPAGDSAPALGIVAHTRKPKADERTSGRGLLATLAGSYVLGSVPRCAFVMQAASDDPEDRRVVWTCCKNNDGEMGARSAWVRSNGLFAPVADFDWDAFESAGRSDRTTITEADMAAVFENGAKRRKPADAAKLLMAEPIGAGRTAAYAAIKLDGRFGTRLTEADGLLSWK